MCLFSIKVRAKAAVHEEKENSANANTAPSIWGTPLVEKFRCDSLAVLSHLQSIRYQRGKGEPDATVRTGGIYTGDAPEDIGESAQF